MVGPAHNSNLGRPKTLWDIAIYVPTINADQFRDRQLGTGVAASKDRQASGW
jgi:hypothetical protein